MRSVTQFFMKTFGLSLAAIASSILANGALAADASTAVSVNTTDAAQQPVEEVGKLDEIWVRGKRLSQMIEEAEDDFFVLYNKLNKNYDYDVFCGPMSLHSGSMIMVRSCVPGFIVSNYGDKYGRISYEVDGCSNWIGDWIGEPYFVTYGQPCAGRSRQESQGDYAFPYGPPATYAAIGLPADHLLMVKRPAYAANVLKVVNSDPRLLDKVRNLDALYKEMDLVQGRYLRVKGDAAPSRGRHNARNGAGPRGL